MEPLRFTVFIKIRALCYYACMAEENVKEIVCRIPAPPPPKKKKRKKTRKKKKKKKKKSIMPYWFWLGWKEKHSYHFVMQSQSSVRHNLEAMKWGKLPNSVLVHWKYSDHSHRNSLLSVLLFSFSIVEASSKIKLTCEQLRGTGAVFRSYDIIFACLGELSGI